MSHSISLETGSVSLRQNWQTLATLIFCVFLGALDFQIMGPLIPTIMDSLGESANQGGLLITVFNLTAGVVALCGGPFSDRWGRKNMILLSGSIIGTAAFLMGMSSNFNTVLIIRGMAGAGAALLLPNCFALAGDLFPYQQRGMVMGFLIGGSGGAAILGVPLCTSIAQFFSWNWTFGFMGVVAVVLLFLVSFLIPSSKQEKSGSKAFFSSYLSHFYHALTLPSVFFALVGMFLWYGGLMGFIQNFGIYYSKTFGLSVGEIGLLFFIPGVTYFLGSVIGGKISDKVGKRKMIFFAALWAGNAALAFAIFNHNFLASIFIIALWAGCFGMGESSLIAIISELGQETRGTVLSLNNTFIYSATAFITFISSLLLALDRSFLLIGILSTFSLFTALIVFKFLVKNHFVREAF